MTQSTSVKPPIFTRSVLPDPRSYRGSIVNILESDGSLHPYMSDGTSWNQVDDGSGSVPDATGSVKGKVQLTGAFGGSAAVPTVFGLADESALNDYVVARAGGGGAPTLVSYATAIPLNLVDPGSYMAPHAVVANTVFTAAVGSVDDGACRVVVVMDGTHTVDVTAFNIISGATLMSSGILTGVNGHAYALQFIRLSSTIPLQVGVSDLGLATALPTLVSATVSNSTPSRIDLVWSASMNSAISAFGAFTVSAGHTLTAHTYVDATHSYLTTSTPFVNSEAARTLAYTQPGTNNMQDLLGNLVANFSGATITNGVLAPARVDNFTRANSVLTMGTPSDGGSAWVNLSGSPFGISGSQGYCTSSSVNSIAVLETGNLDHQQIMTFNPVSEDYSGYCFRFVDPNNYLWVFFQASSGHVNYQAVVGGSATNLTSPADGSYTINTTTTVQARLSGATVQIWINGAHMTAMDYTIVDPVLLTGTKIGWISPGAGNYARLLGLA